MKSLLLLILSGVLLVTTRYMQHQNSNQTVDGPYVLYRGDTVIIHHIDSISESLQLRTTVKTQNDAPIQLTVGTDEPGKTFSFSLKRKMKPENSFYSRPKKMLVLSDIEGNFTAFRKLLQAAEVIDENYQWTFGDGHLVLAGDFVDRGNMVTEVLWLIYALEEQAEKARGKVHFILGNHEIMNMTNDVAYVHPRYLNHASMMQIPYMELFGKQSEIGRWLATKNIMERIGNMLFVHGGVSAEVNTMQMAVDDINNAARPFYTDTAYLYPNHRVELLFNNHGPFWYRGYYYGAVRATMDQIDSTLYLYQCRHIVTGHTIIANSIVSVFDGKVIDTDVHHADGHSEALLVERNTMTRIKPSGEKLPLATMNH